MLYCMNPPHIALFVAINKERRRLFFGVRHRYNSQNRPFITPRFSIFISVLQSNDMGEVLVADIGRLSGNWSWVLFYQVPGYYFGS